MKKEDVSQNIPSLNNVQLVKEELTNYVLTGSFRSGEGRQFFMDNWTKLTREQQDRIKQEVNFENLALCDWKFIIDALSHSKMICVMACITGLTAAKTTYDLTENLPYTALNGAIGLFVGGIGTFSFFKNKSIKEDSQRWDRLNDITTDTNSSGITTNAFLTSSS